MTEPRRRFLRAIRNRIRLAWVAATIQRYAPHVVGALALIFLADWLTPFDHAIEASLVVIGLSVAAMAVGVARLRVFGEVVVDWTRAASGGRTVDLASIKNGGLVLAASDVHYGATDNMLMPGRAKNMGDGWETRRRRG